VGNADLTQKIDELYVPVPVCRKGNEDVFLVSNRSLAVFTVNDSFSTSQSVKSNGEYDQNTSMKDSSTIVLGFALLFLSLVCLGTWPALLRLSSTPNAPKVCDVLYFRNRDTRFAYLDYALSYVVSSSIPLALALAHQEPSDGSSPTALILFAVGGGCLLSMGNMALQWATTIFGAPLTTVVAIQASITVLLGTSINYLLQPHMTGRPDFLLAGVVVFLAAIGLATRAHLLYGEGRDAESSHGIHSKLGPGKYSYGSLESEDSLDSIRSMENGLKTTGPVVDPPPQVHAKSETYSPRLALLISIFGGCCFGFFSPAFNVAVNDPFHWSGDTASPLSVPLANLWFSIAFTIASFAGNVPLMYYPPPQFGWPETTFAEYCVEPLSERKLAIFAGLLCGSANLLQFQGGSLVGFATADLVQAFPLVSTLWDIFLFGEYRNAGSMVLFYIFAMYAMYTCGIGFLISSTAMS